MQTLGKEGGGGGGGRGWGGVEVKKREREEGKGDEKLGGGGAWIGKEDGLQ